MINHLSSKKLHSKLPVHPILCVIVRSITYFYARHAPIILMHYTTGQLEKTEKLAITHTYKHRYSNNQKWKTPKKRDRVALKLEALCTSLRRRFIVPCSFGCSYLFIPLL